MNRDMLFFPIRQGFYKMGSLGWEICDFADSKQITKNKYKLQHDLFYRAKNGFIYVVKKGFVHDGASKGFLKHFGKYTNASILHDALYANNFNRAISDDLFLESMASSGVSYLRRYTYYWAVRGAGWSAFNSKTKNSIKENRKYLQIIKG